MSVEWDYIIVGGGTAGCVLANRLSASGRHRVLLLDAGIPDRSPYIHVPAGIAKAASDERLNWNYQAEPDVTRGGAVEFWPAGKALGGCSSINGMIHVRGNPRDFDDWAASGAGGWDYQSVLPYFKRAECFEGGADDYRGDDGPHPVSHLRVDHPLTDGFIEAAQQAGHVLNLDYNGERQSGVSRMQVNQRRGWRHSTAKAYLKPARRRSNLDVITEAHVERILTSAHRAVGVQYSQGGESHTVRCNVETILCAGAIASPKILMLSGIGPTDVLDRYEIPVIAATSRVGENLQEHPVAPMAWHVSQPTLNTELNLAGMIKHGLNWLFYRRGAIMMPAGHAQIFFKTDAALDRPNIQAIFTPLCYGTSEGESQADWGLYDKAAVMVGVCLMNTRVRGRITLGAANPAVAPVISHQLLSDADDIKALTAGCEEVRRVFKEAGLAPYVTDEFMPGSSVTTDEHFEEYLMQNIAMGYHAVGTCAMGSDTDSVVDACLRVNGVLGLRVVDASVMPTLTTGNTNAPVVMIAEKAADMILSDSVKASEGASATA
jgi:choline dehydrogenase